MPDTLPLALTPEEWRELRDVAAEWADQARHGEHTGAVAPPFIAERVASHAYWMFEPGRDLGGEGAALLALVNHALPDESPHKITRAMVDVLRSRANEPDQLPMAAAELRHIADVLAFLLPPVELADG